MGEVDETLCEPKGILGLIQDGDEVVGVAFEKDFTPTEEEAEEINAYLVANGLPPLSE